MFCAQGDRIQLRNFFVPTEKIPSLANNLKYNVIAMLNVFDPDRIQAVSCRAEGVVQSHGRQRNKN